jgi:hypothetical protein
MAKSKHTGKFPYETAIFLDTAQENFQMSYQVTNIDILTHTEPAGSHVITELSFYMKLLHLCEKLLYLLLECVIKSQYRER